MTIEEINNYLDSKSQSKPTQINHKNRRVNNELQQVVVQKINNVKIAVLITLVKKVQSTDYTPTTY
jgi:hypothetical protein